MSAAAPDLALPHNLEAEQALLGAILVNAEALDVVDGICDADDFAEPLHRTVFAEAKAMRGRGSGTVSYPLLVAALGSSLAGAELAPGVTAQAYLARLVAEATTVVNAPDYAREIADQAARRSLVATAYRILDQLGTGTASTAETGAVAAEAIEALDRVLQARSRTATPRVSLRVAAADALGGVEQAMRRGTGLAGASWGIPALDKATLGLCPGELVVVAGRPGMGKTALATAIALKTAKAGNGVYDVSLEMTAAPIALRALCAEASAFGDPIPYKDAAKGFPDAAPEMREAMLARLAEAELAIAGRPIEIEQEAGLTLSQIAARARHAAKTLERRGAALKVVIVDHLGLVRASDRYSGSRVNEVSEISAGLKVLAKSLDVCVVALCQLNRQVEARDDKRPKLSDLRDSGSIEQDADVVIGLYREAYYLGQRADLDAEALNRLAAAEKRLEAHVLKQRMGDVTTVHLYCDIATNVVDQLRGPE